MKMMIALIIVFHALTSYAGEKARTPANEKLGKLSSDNYTVESVYLDEGHSMYRKIDRIVDNAGNVCFAVTASDSTAINCIAKK